MRQRVGVAVCGSGCEGEAVREKGSEGDTEGECE